MLAMSFPCTVTEKSSADLPSHLSTSRTRPLNITLYGFSGSLEGPKSSVKYSHDESAFRVEGAACTPGKYGLSANQ